MPDTPLQVQVQSPPLPPGATPAAPGAPVVAPRSVAPDPFIDALQAQMAAERATIEALTARLVPGLNDASASAITDQLEAAQERLSSLQEQLARAQGGGGAFEGVAEAAPPERTIPREAVQMTEMFFVTLAVVAIGVPLARAFGRWLDRRGRAPAAAAAPSLEPRLDRMEQAIEAIAIEVERISEGQRFTNKVMSEMRALPAPNPIEQWPAGSAREAVRESLPAGKRPDR